MNNTHAKLVISRHAESEWNVLGKWTGLTDVDLTEKGHAEARLLGEAIKDFNFQHVYCSEQRRTHQTRDGMLQTAEQPEATHYEHKALNERDYGELTGKNKWEVLDEIGEEAFNGIRRGWDHPVPGGETLKMVHDRVVPFYQAEILPKLLEGQNVLMVAHGNSIRALMKHLENIPEEKMAEVEMPFGHVLVYTIGPDGKILGKEVRTVDVTPPKA